jgi:hypothetical protein
MSRYHICWWEVGGADSGDFSAGGLAGGFGAGGLFDFSVGDGGVIGNLRDLLRFLSQGWMNRDGLWKAVEISQPPRGNGVG